MGVLRSKVLIINACVIKINIFHLYSKVCVFVLSHNDTKIVVLVILIEIQEFHSEGSH